MLRAIFAAGDIIVGCDLGAEHIERCGFFSAGLIMWRIDLAGLDAEDIASLIVGMRSA